jgi:hypothetical protein
MNLKFKELVLPEHRKKVSNFVLMELEEKEQRKKVLKYQEEKRLEMEHYINSLPPSCDYNNYNNININNDNDDNKERPPRVPFAGKLTPIHLRKTQEEEYETTYEDEEALDYQSPPDEEEQLPPNEEEYIFSESQEKECVNDFIF